MCIRDSFQSDIVTEFDQLLKGNATSAEVTKAVSYTHLDVYKRQV